MGTARSEHVRKIRETRKQIETAGFIHKKDLKRQLHRLQKELTIYDKFHAAGR